MNVGRNFSIKQVLLWTRRETYTFTVIATVPTVLYNLAGWHWLALPWLPVALVGTAVAFLVGFKNNASYDRLWEARKIWGAIVNDSRAWGVMVKDFVRDHWAQSKLSAEELQAIHRRMIYRHIAWLTALRFQLRQPRHWEYMYKDYNVEYRKRFTIPELDGDLKAELTPLLSTTERDVVLGKKNTATQLIRFQSQDVRERYEQQLTEDYRHVAMQTLLNNFYAYQGQCERIKNFPYPRQFATINLFFTWIFIALVPFGMLQVFAEAGGSFGWLTIPFSVLVSWVFHTMEKIGETSENPFQGGPADIPMHAISRTIEIDLRDMLDETDLPQPVQAVRDILY